GESNDLWKQPAQTAEGVAAIRKAESMKAAEHLGIQDIDFWGLEDYPIRLGAQEEDRMLMIIRSFRPDIILTHDKNDVLNPDHNSVHSFVWRLSIMSNSSGVETEGFKATRQMRLYGFEPHQTELSGFVPGSFIDISDVYEQKVAAMQCFQAQKHLIKYYTDRAAMRGNHARRLSGDSSIQYAESFANFFPVVDGEFH
ncbi:MAG: PIG-L family deacetylase, partial [Fretibacterium sp.]|nr:PIG-L family deacetylase [Fretibacterium sp.]